MFITNETFRAPINSLFGSKNETYWSSAEVALQHPWFLLTLRQVDRSESEPWVTKRTLLLSSDDQIEQLMSLGEPDSISVESLQIISPSHINGTSNWAMDVVHKVWSAHEPGHESLLISIYETISGRRYTNFALGTPVEDLLVDTLKFEIPSA